MTSVSRQVGALLAFLTLVGAAAAHAQLRSLVAIKHLALESSPGAERQTKGLRTHALTFEVLGVGAVAFASTNVDDIVLLAMWFAQPRRQVLPIVLGQFVGIGALVLVSVVGALTALVLPEAWIPFIGVVPLALGIRALFDKREDHDSDVAPAATGMLAVTAVTMANGADNIGVYIPLFASQLDHLPWFLAIFAVGTGVWCLLGYALVAHPAARSRLQRYGHRVLPWVLIGIGLHVLSDVVM